MKIKTLVASMLLLTASIANAQEITLEMPNARGFSGVQSIANEIVFTTYFGEKTETKGMANFVLKLYDKDLNEIKTTDVEVTKFSELASSAFTGKYFLFIFVDAMKKNRTMVVLDSKGELVKTKMEEDVRRALLVEENFPTIHVLNDEEFILVRPMKEKKFGFEIERLNKDLESKWTKSYIPEDGVWTAVDTKLKDGKFYILREENPNRTSDNYNFSVHCLSVEDGSSEYSIDLKDGEDGGAPAFIRVADNGEVITGGMYFKKSKYDDKNSDGLFLARVSPQGKMNNFTKKSWDSMKDQIQGEFSSALLGGKTKIMVEDVIQKKDGGYMVICEQFKKANNSSMTGSGAGAMLGSSPSSSATTGPEVGFTVLDFVFFNSDATGNLLGIDVVAKDNKEAKVAGKIASGKGLEIANYMKKEGFFCYKEVIEVNGKQVIVYRNDEGFKSKLYFLEVGAKSTEGIPSIDMDRWVSEKLNKLGKFAKATGGAQYTFNSDRAGNDYSLYKNARSFKPGYMLMYDYSGRGLKVWLEAIPMI